ncbi:MAG: Nif3-like dinuclear metal center hexameric protein [Lachnospiraceae bacterium]
MKAEVLFEYLESQYPLDSAEGWDNVGLLIGRRTADITTVLVALDLTEQILEQAVAMQADLIVTHHPLLFSAIKRIESQSFPGAKLLRLIEHTIAAYAVHTNFDIHKMGELNAQALQLLDAQPLQRVAQLEPLGFGKVGNLAKPMVLHEFAEHVKRGLGMDHVLVYGDAGLLVERAAVLGGSGKSAVSDALQNGAQVLVTGDIDHHTAQDAKEQGLALIDAGHFGTEYCFVKYMVHALKERFPTLNVLSGSAENPRTVV